MTTCSVLFRNFGFRCVWLLVGGGLLFSSGCGNKATVSGTVFLDDVPLKNGTVTYRPQATGAVAYGEIQSDGSYSVRTGTSNGLIAGEYAVTVSATSPPPKDETEVKDGIVTEKVGQLLTPLQYADPKTSPLKANVQRGANKVDLKLSSGS